MAAPAAPSISTLKGVGPALAAKLARLGIVDIRDLLLHAPSRYEDRSHVTPIAEAQSGRILIEGEVVLTDIVGKRKAILMCRLKDESGMLDLRFFHYAASLRNRLLPGTRWRCFGEVKFTRFGKEMIHPELESAGAGLEGIVPVYPTTSGLSQKTLRRLMSQSLELLENRPRWLPDLPPRCFPEGMAMPLSAALRALHCPPGSFGIAALNEDRHPLQRRMAFEELLAHQLAFRGRVRLRENTRAPQMFLAEEWLSRFVTILSFDLTLAQQRVITEIRSDLAKPVPMGRLLQGDVGSGKTVVAALAALAAGSSGYQCAFMVPTELLAEQHWLTWSGWLQPLGMRVALLTSRHSGKDREHLLGDVATGKVDVLIGTHALFQKDVHFDRLGLVVVDEQHRFGVDQRMALKTKAKGHVPHYLVMTATPIPRTLAMLRYGEMEVSVIDQLPPGREPVETRVMSEEKRGQLIERLLQWIRLGRQAYWVCPLIEESERLSAEAVEKTAETLRSELGTARIGLVHGRLKAEEKEAVMTAFKGGEIDLLVATTVIEVGVDVPNAGLMVIENSERLGLAQLHQLRGRVGRGGGKSYCILFYRPPLTDTARQRLAFLRGCHDGFALAEKDLALRGPGEILGTRQSGTLRFRMADPVRDRDLLPRVCEGAQWLSRHAPEVIPALLAFWLGKGSHYVDV